MTHTPTPWEVQHMPTETECRKRGDWVMLHGDDWFRAQACVSFFHGQDIPTERIEEGGFWEMVVLLNRCSRYFAYRTDPAYVPGKEVPPVQMRELLAESRALLAKLGVEP